MKRYLEFLNESVDDDFKRDISNIKDELLKFQRALSISFSNLAKVNNRTPEVVKELTIKSKDDVTGSKVTLNKSQEEQPTPPSTPSNSISITSTIKSKKEVPIRQLHPDENELTKQQVSSN